MYGRGYMRIVFMGTPDFAVPSLEKCHEVYDVVEVVTRPDAVRGRGKTLVASPVKQKAQELGIDVLETTRMTPEAIETIRSYNPDIIVVAAYGCILPQEIIDMAPLGCINVHASLLPALRGAAPIQRSIMQGDKDAGISIMKVVKALDAGDYCRQASVAIEDKNCLEVMDELAQIGADELVLAIDDIAQGKVSWTVQDETLVTLAPKVTKDEMRISPAMDAKVAKRYVQGSLDAAPVRISLLGRGVRLLSCALSDKELNSGEVLAEGGRLYLGFDSGTLEVLELKPDGKREMDAKSFCAGLQDVSCGWDSL